MGDLFVAGQVDSWSVGQMDSWSDGKMDSWTFGQLDIWTVDTTPRYNGSLSICTTFYAINITPFNEAREHIWNM